MHAVKYLDYVCNFFDLVQMQSGVADSRKRDLIVFRGMLRDQMPLLEQCCDGETDESVKYVQDCSGPETCTNAMTMTRNNNLGDTEVRQSTLGTPCQQKARA